MKILGLQKQSLIEYPGRISAVIFLGGCNLRCQFCFTGENKVLTNHGLLKIKDIVEKQINCLVYDSEGNFSPIKKYFIRDTSEIIKINTFWRSDVIECTPNHEFLVFDAKKGKFLKKKAEDINKDSDFLTVTIPQKEIRDFKLDFIPAIEVFYQPLKTRPRFFDKKIFKKIWDLRKKGYSWRKIYKTLNLTDHIRRLIEKKDYLDSKIVPPIKFKATKIGIKGGHFYVNRFIKITPEFMRLVGYFLAEGCVSKCKNRKNSYYISFSFNQREKTFIEDVKRIFFKVFKTKLSEIQNKKNKTIQLTSSKGILGIFFQYYFGSDSKNKKIPVEFLYLRKDFQKELIKGLFFGDGVSSQRFLRKYQWQRLSCCSPTLRYQISLILSRLGIRHSIREKEISIKDKKIFEILGQASLITKKTINVGERYGFLDEKYVYLKIKEIRRLKKKQKVYNLEIDNSNHTYNIFLINVSNCYVPHLVLPEEIKKQKEISQRKIFSFLKEREKFLEAVAITGGEPTLNKDLPDFISKIKKMGYLIELETNGTNPKMLNRLIEEKLIDYVAMDIKHRLDDFNKYKKITGGVLTKKIFENIKQSVKILLLGKTDYEFRTTIMKEFHKKEDILAICKEIQGAKKYFLQNYQKNHTLSGNFFTPFREKEIEEIVKEGQRFTKVKYRKYL